MIWIGDVLVSHGDGGVYSERMLGNARVWDPFRSKLSALYHKGTGVEITGETKVLYLGAANGTTVSHVADYADVVYAIEFAPRPMQDLLEVARRREAARQRALAFSLTNPLAAPNRPRQQAGTCNSAKVRSLTVAVRCCVG